MRIPDGVSAPWLLRWIASALLGAAALYLATINWIVFVIGMRGRHAPSWAPLFGGVFGMLALLIAPVSGVRAYWWIPLLADYGTVPGFVEAGLYWLIRSRRAE